LFSPALRTIGLLVSRGKYIYKYKRKEKPTTPMMLNCRSLTFHGFLQPVGGSVCRCSGGGKGREEGGGRQRWWWCFVFIIKKLSVTQIKWLVVNKKRMEEKNIPHRLETCWDTSRVLYFSPFFVSRGCASCGRCSNFFLKPQKRGSPFHGRCASYARRSNKKTL
jgi:hypothetical protein